MLFALALIAAQVDAGPAPAKAEDGIVVDRIVAVVNKNVVLLSEVEGMLDQMMQAEPPGPNQDPVKLRSARRDEILDTLIAEKLLDDEVRKLHIDVTDAEVDRVVDGTMKEHNLTPDQLKMALAHQGLSLEEYKDGLKKQLTKMKIVQLKVKNRVQVTDADVQAKMQQTKILNSLDYKLKARHILVLVPPGTDDKAALAKVNAAKARIEKGEKFEDVAKEVSEDPGSKDRGGDLGEFGRGEMVPEFEKAAFNAEPGKMVGPVRTPFGWHLILVDQRIATETKTGDAALTDIRNKLYQDEIERQFAQYVDELKKDAHIEKRL
jgi:peptidyl-prolyl cis-trans isomerase SurA